MVVPVISLDKQNDNENSGYPDNTDAVSVHVGNDIDELFLEDNHEDCITYMSPVIMSVARYPFCLIVHLKMDRNCFWIMLYI